MKFESDGRAEVMAMKAKGHRLDTWMGGYDRQGGE